MRRLLRAQSRLSGCASVKLRTRAVTAGKPKPLNYLNALVIQVPQDCSTINFERFADLDKREAGLPESDHVVDYFS